MAETIEGELRELLATKTHDAYGLRNTQITEAPRNPAPSKVCEFRMMCGALDFVMFFPSAATPDEINEIHEAVEIQFRSWKRWNARG